MSSHKNHGFIADHLPQRNFSIQAMWKNKINILKSRTKQYKHILIFAVANHAAVYQMHTEFLID